VGAKRYAPRRRTKSGGIPKRHSIIATADLPRFFRPPRRRKPGVLTAEVQRQAQELLDGGKSVPEVAGEWGRWMLWRNTGPRRFLPCRKHCIDTLKMLAYRAETSMASTVRENLARSDDARALLRPIYNTEVDLLPGPNTKTLTVTSAKNSRPPSPLFQARISAWCTNLGQPKFHEIRSSETHLGGRSSSRPHSVTNSRRPGMSRKLSTNQPSAKGGTRVRTDGGTASIHLHECLPQLIAANA